MLVKVAELGMAAKSCRAGGAAVNVIEWGRGLLRVVWIVTY